MAKDQGYMNGETFDGIYQQAEKTSKMISRLITYLRANEEKFKQKKKTIGLPNKRKKQKKLKKPDKR